MADNGMWFKLWIGADEDPDLGDLSLEDFARWCKFGLYLKKYGTEGTVELKEPCLPLQHKFKVTSFNAVIQCISMFPNCTVTRVTNATVTWQNWLKYQGDNSKERTRRYRASVTAKKRREEMRRDEMRKEENKPPKSPKGDLVDDDQLLLPDWLPDKAWNDYRQYRRNIKKPMTEKAERLAIKKLDLLRQDGNDPTAVIEQSIMSSWRGLFEVKTGRGKPEEDFNSRLKRSLMRGL